MLGRRRKKIEELKSKFVPGSPEETELIFTAIGEKALPDERVFTPVTAWDWAMRMMQVDRDTCEVDLVLTHHRLIVISRALPCRFEAPPANALITAFTSTWLSGWLSGSVGASDRPTAEVP